VLDAKLIVELQAVGLDPAKKMLPPYPRELTCKVVLICARGLNPTMREDDALRAFGRRFVQRYADSLIGKALLSALRLPGPGKMLVRVATRFRTANNDLETEVTHLRHGAAELWCNDLAYGAWFEGIIVETLESAGAKEPGVHVMKSDASGTVFANEWK
jgi:uncharacterized protein (TIGR02265 family)